MSSLNHHVSSQQLPKRRLCNEFLKDSFESSFSVEEPQQCSSLLLESENVCEEVLGNKMAALELNDLPLKGSSAGGGDGSDSGVDIATSLTIGLQRALSSNSGGYASSNGGLDEIQEANGSGNGGGGGNLSCDSSMISYSSDICDNKTASTVLSQNSNYECTSENGSESSSVAGGPAVRKLSVIKKKVAVSEPINVKTPRNKVMEQTSPLSNSQLNKSRSRTASVNRTPSTTKPSPPMLQTRERARSREKASTTPSSKSSTPPIRSTPIRRPPKPDTLPSALVTSPSIQRILQRTPSVTRARTPGTPSDDGRWPSVGGRGVTLAPKRGSSATPEMSSIKSRVNMMSLDLKSSAATLDKYATLPRRKKQKSVEDLVCRSSRSSSASRENKMTSSVIVTSSNSSSNSKKVPVSTSIVSYRESTPSRVLPPFPKLRKPAPKTRIYHETSVQTAITSADIENAFAGAVKNVQVDAIDLAEKGTQSDIRDREIEFLQEQIRQLAAARDHLDVKLIEKSQKLTNLELQLNREREEKLSIQRELHLNTERVIGMLELTRATPTDEQGCDSLLMLESQIQMSGHELEQKQDEINKLRRICRTLQVEMERSLATQQSLMEEKATIERESSELQDFLQNEKIAMCDALKDAEAEYQVCQKKLQEREEEVKVLRDECRHLVRLNEQRRQENKTMQSKYHALECRSKDLIVQQSTAVAGASSALSGLHSRLDSLVEQLICSYNISERDLEDVVFHNEAYTNSVSSEDGSPECDTIGGLLKCTQQQQNDGSLSPQRNQSFIAAVISAIKSATTSSKKLTRLKKQHEDHNADDSDSTEMLDSETEPCLMMDNVLEDAPMPDSHSHNMISSSGMMISQIDVPSDIMHGDESLHNLSQAIVNRQQIELQISSMAAASAAAAASVAHKNAQIRNQSEHSMSDDISGHDSVAEMPSISDYCSAQALVDQVIEVDNLVTKLLKVLRLIQMDNDNCIQQLISDKNKLQLNKEEMLEKLKDYEDMNEKLRDELVDATEQLILKDNDLSTSKTELQRHRNEIDRLTQDICNLSTLCSQSHQYDNQKCNEIDQEHSSSSTDEILASLKIWKEQGQLLEPEVIAHIVTTLREVTPLRERVLETEILDPKRNLNSSWPNNAIEESKRQYEVIDKALDVLQSIQGVVEQCPALAQMQKDLEEANFHSATTLPMYTALVSTNSNDDDTADHHHHHLHFHHQHQQLTEDVNANESPKLGSSGVSYSCDTSGNQTQINSPA